MPAGNESIMENPKVVIEFERSNRLYSPGDNITGSISIQLSKATKCKGISYQIMLFPLHPFHQSNH